MTNPKRPADANRKAKFIVEIATGEKQDVLIVAKKRGRKPKQKAGTTAKK